MEAGASPNRRALGGGAPLSDTPVTRETDSYQGSVDVGDGDTGQYTIHRHVLVPPQVVERSLDGTARRLKTLRTVSERIGWRGQAASEEGQRGWWPTACRVPLGRLTITVMERAAARAVTDAPWTSTAIASSAAARVAECHLWGVVLRARTPGRMPGLSA
jgi:hypothetical protein